MKPDDFVYMEVDACGGYEYLPVPIAQITAKSIYVWNTSVDPQNPKVSWESKKWLIEERRLGQIRIPRSDLEQNGRADSMGGTIFVLEKPSSEIAND